jgi:hypothetical protein
MKVVYLSPSIPKTAAQGLKNRDMSDDSFSSAYYTSSFLIPLLVRTNSLPSSHKVNIAFNVRNGKESLELRASILLLYQQRFVMPKKTFARCGVPFLQYLLEILPRCLSLSCYPTGSARVSVSYSGVSEMHESHSHFGVFYSFLAVACSRFPRDVSLRIIVLDHRLGSSLLVGVFVCELLARWNTSMSFTG